MNGLNYLQLQYDGCKMEASFGLMSIGNPIAATRVGGETTLLLFSISVQVQCLIGK